MHAQAFMTAFVVCDTVHIHAGVSLEQQRGFFAAPTKVLRECFHTRKLQGRVALMNKQHVYADLPMDISCKKMAES